MKIVVALCVAVLTVGCSREKSGSTSADPGSATMPTNQGSGPAPGTPASTGNPTATGTVVIFARSGGIAGFNDTLVVNEDGSLTLTDKNGKVRKASASSADIRRLKSLLGSAEFKALPASATSHGADLITYGVSVPGVGTVSTMDGVTNPAVLDQVLQEMQALMEKVRLSTAGQGPP